MWRWRAGNDSEASWLMDDGHLLGVAGCDFPAATQEADLPRFLDDPCVVGRKMQIEEFRWWSRTPADASFGSAFFDRLEGCEPGGSRDMFLVMPLDLGRKQLVGLFPASDRFHGEECRKPFLPEVKLTFDFALRLGIFGHQVADAKAAEGALELGERIGIAGLA